MVTGMMGKMGPMGCGPEMMKKGMEMKEKMMGAGFNPQEMCRQMTSAVTKAAEMGSYATPEVRALFEDWVGQVEKEIITVIDQSGESNPGDIAQKLRIKEDSVIFFISRLAQQKKIKISAIELCDVDVGNGSEEVPVEKQACALDNQAGGG
ncbi:hypothetical protein JOC37_002287 [Desulfohalotomaculum tongense]|uniref:hypothetical protein n=1 Tax=Desulforadius tongensis TaxID=1216062 RepID=UPI00195AF324|nr:hypothetical protein [Desulforadius tongensis]MBM7855866.1 hypothetical protein [Desulforadius tongensis]